MLRAKYWAYLTQTQTNVNVKIIVTRSKLYVLSVNL